MVQQRHNKGTTRVQRYSGTTVQRYNGTMQQQQQQPLGHRRCAKPYNMGISNIVMLLRICGKFHILSAPG